jgi:hypothetical protein
MEFTAFAAVLTNCALMGLISDQMHLWLPTSLNTLKVDCKKYDVQRGDDVLFFLLS